MLTRRSSNASPSKWLSRHSGEKRELFAPSEGIFRFIEAESRDTSLNFSTVSEEYMKKYFFSNDHRFPTREKRLFFRVSVISVAFGNAFAESMKRESEKALRLGKRGHFCDGLLLPLSIPPCARLPSWSKKIEIKFRPLLHPFLGNQMASPRVERSPSVRGGHWVGRFGTPHTPVQGSTHLASAGIESRLLSPQQPNRRRGRGGVEADFLV